MWYVWNLCSYLEAKQEFDPECILLKILLLTGDELPSHCHPTEVPGPCSTLTATAASPAEHKGGQHLLPFTASLLQSSCRWASTSIYFSSVQIFTGTLASLGQVLCNTLLDLLWAAVKSDLSENNAKNTRITMLLSVFSSPKSHLCIIYWPFCFSALCFMLTSFQSCM